MRGNVKWLFLQITFFCFLVTAEAADLAQSLDLDSYMNSAWRSKSIELREQNLNQYGETGFLNPIEGMQLKLSKDQSEDDDRQLALRIKPRGLTEFKLLRTLRGQSTRLEKMAYDQQLSEAMRDRYLTYVEFISAHEKRRVLQTLISIEKREVAMLATAARSALANAKDLVKGTDNVQLSEEKLAGLESQISLLLLKMKTFDKTLKMDSDKISNLNYKSLPTPVDLEKMIQKTVPLREAHQSDSSLLVKLQQEKAEQAKNAIFYEQARTEKFFDYFEIKVSEDRKERVYGFEVGLNIPGFSSGGYDLREKSRRLIEYDLEAQSAETEQNLLIASTKMSLKNSINLWKSFVANENPILQKRMKKLARSQDPLLAISLEKDELSKSLRQHEVGEEALKNYVLFLSAVDLLAHHPKVNFLSPELRELRP